MAIIHLCALNYYMKEVTNLDSLPKKLKHQRQQLGLTQSQLSARIGITQAFLAEIESGRKRPSIEVLEKLCDALVCSADYLLGIAQQHRYKTLNQPTLLPALSSRGITLEMLEELAERNVSGEELRLAIKLAQAMKDDKQANANQKK